MDDDERFITISGQVASIESKRIQMLNADGVSNTEISNSIYLLHERHHCIVVLHNTACINKVNKIITIIIINAVKN